MEEFTECKNKVLLKIDKSSRGRVDPRCVTVMEEFTERKNKVLLKIDKSSRGRVDPRCVTVCDLLNNIPYFYTTSSCSGRFYLYSGVGNKKDGDGFRRWQVSHDFLTENSRESFFNFDGFYGIDGCEEIWLRYEPFILHVACQSLTAASALIKTARKAGFKTVGLQSFDSSRDTTRQPLIVQVLGDDQIDMPVCMGRQYGDDKCISNNQDICTLISNGSDPSPSPPHPHCPYENFTKYLMNLVNTRQVRNLDKIKRFEKCLAELEREKLVNDHQELSADKNNSVKQHEIIGDVAIVKNLTEEDDIKKIGTDVLKSNGKIKVVAHLATTLKGITKSPTTLSIIAGSEARMRSGNLLTTHCEFGIKVVVDVNNTFFTSRLSSERIRLCNAVSRNENVLSLFSGVGLEAIMIASKREVESVTCVEINSVAVECMKKSLNLLVRNKSVAVKGGGQAARDKVTVIEGDVNEVLLDSELVQDNFYDRILCPRPKDTSSSDGDMGDGSAGKRILKLIARKMKDRGEVHYYDFAADWELEGGLERTKADIRNAIEDESGRKVEFLHAGKAGSGTIAKRQFRVVVDFRII